MEHRANIRIASSNCGQTSAILIKLAIGAITLAALSGCGSGSSSSSTTPPPVLTVAVSPASVTLDSGQAQTFHAVLTNDTTNAGVSWTVSGGGALSGSTTSATTLTASATSSATVTLTATSVASSSASGTASVVVNPALTIHAPSSGTGDVNTAYSDTSTSAAGGSGNKVFAVASGSLPAGLSLSASTGAISGTPTAAGTYTFTLSVTDSATTPVTVSSAAVTITIINSPIAVSITNAAAKIDAGQTAALSATVANDVANAGVAWTVSGGGSLTGSTTSATTFNAPSTVATAFTATVKATSNADLNQSATTSIAVSPLPKITVGTVLPAGSVGVAYTFPVTVSGGTAPLTYSLTGSLPAGLSLNTATGLISGTPTTATTSPATFSIAATDSAAVPQSVSQSTSLSINTTAALTIATHSIPAAVPSTPYTTTLSASGGTAPYTWSIPIGTLPSGMALNSSTGVISGTTTATTESSFTIQVTDSATPTAATATHIFQLVVQPALPAGANDAELTGTYAFRLAGWSNGGTPGKSYGAAAVGSLTFDGAGNITSGVEDVNNVTSPATANPITGTYTLGSDNRGTIFIDNGSSVVQLSIAAGSISNSLAHTIHMIRFDDPGASAFSAGVVATGEAKLQTSSAFTQLNQTFVFGMQGSTPCVGCGTVTVSPFGSVSLAGYFVASGGVITGGLEDGASVNASYNNISLGGSTTAPSATTGRGTMTLTPTGTLFPAAPTHFAYYVVSSSEIFLMSIDPHGSLASTGLYTLLSGEAFAQQVSAYSSATFTSNAIAYGNAVIGGDGVSNYGTGTGAGIYRFSFTPGTSTVNATIDSNSSGTVTSQAYPSTTYQVSAAGRFTLPANPSGPVFYFYGNGQGFGTLQPNSTQTGSSGLLTVEAQAAGPFSIPSLASSFIFRSLPPGIYGQGTNVGAATLSSSGLVNATLDSSNNAGNLVSDQALSGTLSLDSGTGSTTGRGSFAGQSVLYIINPKKMVSIDSTSTAAPNTTVFEAQ
jgi:hypothetical protein